MKRLLSVFIAVILSCTSMIALADNSIKVYTDSNIIDFDEDSGIPYMSQTDRTMVPLRKSMEDFGATVMWDEATSSATIQKGTSSVTVTIGQNQIVTDSGKKISIDEPPVEFGGRIYLPIRAVAESLGGYVLWNNDTNTAYLMSDKYTSFRDSFTYNGEVSKFVDNTVVINAYYNGDMNPTEFAEYWASKDKAEISEFVRAIAADKKNINPEYEVFINFWYTDGSPNAQAHCVASVSSISYEANVYNPFVKSEINSLNQ